jgi:hypothetical protein
MPGNRSQSAEARPASIPSALLACAGRPSSFTYAIESKAASAAAPSPLSPGRVASACPLRNVIDIRLSVVNRSLRSETACVRSCRYIITPWQQTSSKVRPPHNSPKFSTRRGQPDGRTSRATRLPGSNTTPDRRSILRALVDTQGMGLHKGTRGSGDSNDLRVGAGSRTNADSSIDGDARSGCLTWPAPPGLVARHRQS